MTASLYLGRCGLSRAVIGVFLPMAVLFSGNADAESEGELRIEYRRFTSGHAPGYYRNDPSVAASFQAFGDMPHGAGQWNVAAFGRFARSESRAHLDLGELNWVFASEDYEVLVGVTKVRWGVVESHHLVDVINQADYLEDVEGEQKLGQPMLALSRYLPVGTVQAFVLPYFRERQLPDERDPLGTPLPVSSHADYESGAGNRHVDYAIRYSASLGSWDIGLAWFDGTSRGPILQPRGDVLTPYYPQMTQLSLDAAGIVGNWLLKVEALQHRSVQDFHAVVSGFELTFPRAILDGQGDVGLIAEYQYNSAGQGTSFAQNDLFFGSRFRFNDFSNSEVLFGISQDLDSSSSAYAKLEISSRLSNQVKWYLRGWMFRSDDFRDPLYAFKDSDFIETALYWFF